MKDYFSKPYEPKLSDVKVSVSRYEYEKREASTKEDLAELFISMHEIKTYLEQNGAEFPVRNEAEHEDAIKRAVANDRNKVMEDMADELHVLYLKERLKPGLINQWRANRAKKNLKHQHLTEELQRYSQDKLDKNRLESNWLRYQ